MQFDRPTSIPRSGPEIWVRRLGARDDTTFVFASPSFWLVWVHWEHEHSEPCFKDHSKCPGHRKGTPRRVRCYAYGYSTKGKAYEFIELPPSCSNTILENLMEGETLRGKRFRLVRGDGKKARIQVVRLSDLEGEALQRLAADMDPSKTLTKLWGIEDLLDGPAAKPSVEFSDQ